MWIKDHKEQLLVDYHDVFTVLEQIVEKVFPIMEKWAETNLTSGGVRTYIYRKGKLDEAGILDALRAGNSFLTDGPILIPGIWDEHEKRLQIPGEHVQVEKTQKNVRCEIVLLTNRPLTKLTVYSEKGVKEVLDLQNTEHAGDRETYYDYSTKAVISIEDCACLYFVAESDCTNMAMSNPIFLDKKNQL